MYPSLFIILFSLTALSPSAHAAGGRSDGGADPRKMDAESVRLLLEDGSLKRAMQNYLSSISLSSVNNDSVRATLTRVIANGALRKDIETTGNYVIEARCHDAYDNSVAASAHIGDVGGPICFDVERLADSYRELSREEGMIRLAALAFHEHIHHFQDPKSPIEEIEREAYRVGAYVELTAKVVQEPLLKWDPSHSPRGNRGPDEDKFPIELPEVKRVTCRGIEIIGDGNTAEEHIVKVRMGKGIAFGRPYDAVTDYFASSDSTTAQGNLITKVTRIDNDYTFAFGNLGKFVLELHPPYLKAWPCRGDQWLYLDRTPLEQRPINAPKDCHNDYPRPGTQPLDGIARAYTGDRWVGKLTVREDVYGARGGPMLCTAEF